MGSVFVPYSVDNTPAAIEIKGHRLLILSTKASDLRKDLKRVGGTNIRKIELSAEIEQQNAVLSQLALSAGSGVVITPPGVSLTAMIENLEKQLPWLQ